MRKLLTAGLLLGLLALPGAARLAPALGVPPEACQAVNPGQPTCTFTVTHNTTGPVSGVAGRGSWVVKVKRGKATLKIQSNAAGDPQASAFIFQTGDKVTATALTPGSALAVGGE